MAVKNTLITAGISVLGTIAVGGVKALQDLTIVTPAPIYSAPQPLTTADWLWYQVMWWLLPVAGGVLIFAMIRNRSTGKESKPGSRERREFDQWRLDRWVGSGSATTKTLEPEKAKIEWLGLADAIKKSDKNTWVLGQGIEHQLDKTKQHIAGQLFRVSSNSHFAILGATRSGKTKSAGFMLVLLARAFNWHVIVLDGKGGQDWRKYGGGVEWHDLTPQNLAHYVTAVHDEYKGRQDYLNAHDAGELSELPREKKLQHILVIFEEFGSTWVGANKDKQVDAMMDNLFRRACAAGIHLCLIDQAPELWSRQMATNSSVALCFRAKGQTLNAFGGYYCGNLNVGEFCDDTSIYRSWYVGDKEEGYDLRKLRRQEIRLLPMPTVHREMQSVRQEVFTGVREQCSSRVEAPAPVFTNTDEGDSKWVAWIAGYAELHPTILREPPRGIRQLARAMSKHETGSEDNDGRYVGIASETCRLLRERQNV